MGNLLSVSFEVLSADAVGQKLPEINYDANAANLDASKKVNIPVNPVKGGNFSQEVSLPLTPPTSMPSDSSGYDSQSGSEPSSVESTINILNTPAERIRGLNKDLYDKSRVISELPTVQPKAINGVIIAHLSPGAVSPVVRLSKNRTTAIIITDMTGQPWPIVNYDGLNKEDFIVKRLDGPSPEGSVLSVTPRNAFVFGNLTLMLKGLSSPLSIDFMSAQKEVDAKAEIRVQGQGPNSKYSSIGIPSSLDTSLLSVLQGVSPLGSKELKVSTAAVQGWLGKDGYMYIRTRYKIMSPAFSQVTSSPDGTYAYKMIAVPVVLYKVDASHFGEFSISGF